MNGTQKSFLKWPGSKSQTLEAIIKLLPEGDRFIEPFVGSGIVFLNVDYPKKIIADRNYDLINLYKTLKKQGESFIEYAETFFGKRNNSKKRYYKCRDLFNTTTDLTLKAALLIYLNKHGFNGLCRYNLKGIYNVPYGSNPAVNFPLKEIEEFRVLAKKASIKHCDFRKIFKRAREGDIIYCDPPYVPLSDTANLTLYAPFKFDNDDHAELAQCAKDAVKVGAKVLISNHDTKFTRKLYKGAKIKSSSVQRRISGDIKGRVKTKEIMALFG